MPARRASSDTLMPVLRARQAAGIAVTAIPAGRVGRRTGMRTRLIAVVSALLLLAAGGGSGSSGNSGSGGSGMDLKIVQPADGTSVSTPFTVKVSASLPLGSQASGKHHIHVWFDDNANQYQVVEADNVRVDSGK